MRRCLRASPNRPALVMVVVTAAVMAALMATAAIEHQFNLGMEATHPLACS